MTSASTKIVYDAASVWFPSWPLPLLGLVAGLVGLGLFGYVGGARRGVAALRLLATALVVFGPAWALVVGTALFAQHARLRTALRAGSFTPVEGVVYDRPSGSSGGSAQAWVVESGERAHWYRYDASRLSAGYRRRAPGDGGVRNGDSVRIADVGGRIARLEIVRGEGT